jgi:pyruvate kinase
MQKRTKIVCTIGPACDSETTLLKMIKAGMNVARLNFSHGIWDWHLATLKKIRKVAKKANEPIAIIQDLQGPKIRVGSLPESIVLKEGKKFVLILVFLIIKMKLFRLIIEICICT